MKMFRAKFQFNRRWRKRIFVAAAGLSLFVWLFMAAAEIHPPLHAWLHGGAIPDNDDCAVVAIALGHFHSVIAEIPPVMPVHWIQIEPRPEISVFVPADKNLPNERAPPVFCFVS